MGKKWPHEAVSEAGGLAPEGMLTVKVVKGEEKETSERTGNKYMISFKTRIVEPKSVKNQPYSINFVIGNDDDPEADEKSTWMGSFAASRYKSFLKAADVPETGDVEEELESAAGAIVRVENGHSEDGKYNDPRSFYRNGEVSDTETENEDEDEPEEKPARKPARKAARKVVEDDEEPEDEDFD